ncbi:hypothetical protein AB6A40_007344 [Gnathostoma spinigerum]|uniref:Bis(5'-nucleosyl)-tetraphosphatase [asymmetrical] n=1 Tax=Gnathostoma spinigerum TaxID=75299 RepID=A0ABD6EM68_9BILA
MSAIVRAAGILIYRRFNDEVQYLLLQASYPPYHWTPPKVVTGHVDSGEDEWTAAVRETKEESGLDIAWLDVHKDFQETLHYEVIQSRYDGEVRKQKSVKYWLAKLKPQYSVKLSNEHQNMKWAALEEAIETVKFEDICKMLQKAEEHLKMKGDCAE